MSKRRRNGLSKGLKKLERTAIKEKIGILIGKNYRQEKIIRELKIQPRHYAIYYNELVEDEIKAATKGGSYGNLSRFAENCRERLKVLEEAMIEAPKKKRTASAAVRAAKLAQDIHNDVVKFACDLGLIQKHSKQVAIDGFVFSQT